MSKKLLLAIVVVLVCTSVALALDPMGPPTAGLSKGQWNAGFEYGFCEMDLEVDNWVGGSGELDDVEINKYYATVGYGIADDWEIYTRLGGADIEFDGVGDDFNGDTDFAFAVGTKKTFAGEGNVHWGALFQVAWLQSEDKVGPAYFAGDPYITTGMYGSKMEVEIYEVQIALGPTVKISGEDSIYLYGGPFLHLLDGDIEARCRATGYREQLDLEEDAQFGGFLGTLINLGHNISAIIEGQVTPEAYLFAAGAKVTF